MQVCRSIVGKYTLLLINIYLFYNIKEGFLTCFGVLLGIERRLPTALPSCQLLSFLISLCLSHFLSLQREGGECHDAAIRSFVIVWLQAAYRRWLYHKDFEEEVIPFREQLAIAFQFLDDKSLSSYLRRMTKQACIFTGLILSAMDVLQSYVDRTGNVQSAAILSSYVCPQRFKDRRAERWLESYRNLLDGFKKVTVASSSGWL